MLTILYTFFMPFVVCYIFTNKSKMELVDIVDIMESLEMEVQRYKLDKKMWIRAQEKQNQINPQIL
jgi:hypothetical protein